MEIDSALYQLIDTRMNGIVSSDREYQAILRRSDEYSDRLERIGLPVDIRQLIDRYVSEQNALDAGMGCPLTCLGFPTTTPCSWGNDQC